MGTPEKNCKHGTPLNEWCQPCEVEINAPERALEEQAAIAVAALFDIANKMNDGERVLINAFGEAMRRQHRTLVQGFWRVMAKVIATYALTGSADLRNEDSLKWAKEVSKTEAFMRFI